MALTSWSARKGTLRSCELRAASSSLCSLMTVAFNGSIWLRSSSTSRSTSTHFFLASDSCRREAARSVRSSSMSDASKEWSWWRSFALVAARTSCSFMLLTLRTFSSCFRRLNRRARTKAPASPAEPSTHEDDEALAVVEADMSAK